MWKPMPRVARQAPPPLGAGPWIAGRGGLAGAIPLDWGDSEAAAGRGSAFACWVLTLMLARAAGTDRCS